MEWQAILILLISVPIVFLPVAFVWYLNIGGLYQAYRRARLEKKEGITRVCSVNNDCPPGQICLNGLCVPDTVRSA